MTGVTRPLTVLIAALGGEGGGVLANWIVNAAIAEISVQATSIPGSPNGQAQPIIMWTLARKNSKRCGGDLFFLSPAIGEVDVMIATELAEGSRAPSAGYITPDRTTLIGSTHRVYLTVEKMGMGDGRLDEKKLYSALKKMRNRQLCSTPPILLNGKGP